MRFLWEVWLTEGELLLAPTGETDVNNVRQSGSRRCVHALWEKWVTMRRSDLNSLLG